MIRRAAGRVVSAGFGRARLAHPPPPPAAAAVAVLMLESSVISPQRWGGDWAGSLVRRDARHGEGLQGFCRGLAAGHGGTRSGGRGKGGGGGGGGGGGAAAGLNDEITGARSVEDILGLVENRGKGFDFIHVANAMNKLVMKGPRSIDGCKLEGERLRLDPRFAQLIDLVRSRCHKFRDREIANVLHALGVFQADLDAVSIDEKLAAQLAEIAERETRRMNPQNVANTYNALCKLEAVAATVSSSGWAGMAQAAGRTAREMNPQNVANTLNALSKLEAAAVAVAPPGWAGMAQAAGRTARQMNPQDVANTLNALCYLIFSMVCLVRNLPAAFLPFQLGRLQLTLDSDVAAHHRRGCCRWISAVVGLGMQRAGSANRRTRSLGTTTLG